MTGQKTDACLIFAGEEIELCFPHAVSQFYYFISLKGIFEHPRMILQHLYALEWHFGSHINTIQIILLSPGNQHQI